MSCIFPLCRFNSLPGKEFCVHHNKHFGTADVKVKKPIAKKSAKRIKEDKTLSKKLKEVKLTDDRCKVHSKVCTGKSEGWHHLQKTSPANRMDEKNIIPCCNACNLEIEINPNWAKANGFLISRFKK